MDLTTWENWRAKLNLGRIAKPALAGAVALAVMVAVLAGRTFIDTATATDFATAPAQEVRVEARSDSSGEAAQTIFVHVVGCVARPGLVEVERGSRVADAVNAAGGFTEDARSDSVNLAREVQDGEQVVVSSSEQVDDPAGAVQPQGAPVGADISGDRVNINAATSEQLQALPGIGPALAERIVGDRAANGAFASVQDITRVSGIGEKKFAQIESLICV